MILNEINKVKTILGPKNVSRFYLLVPLDIICSLLEILSISVIIPFVIAISDKKRVLSSDYSYLIFDYFNDYNQFVLFSGIFLIIILFISSGLSIFSQHKLISLANEIGQETSQIRYKKYLFSSYKFHQSSNTSELTKILITEVSRFTQNVLIAALKLFSKSIFLLIIVIFMLIINPLISFYIFSALTTAYLIIYRFFRNRLFSNGIKISNSNKIIYSIISESLKGIKETKFYSLEDHYFKDYSKNSYIVARSTASSQIRSLIPKNIVEFLILTSLILIINFLNSSGQLINNLPLISFYLYSGYRALPALQQIYNSSALIKSNFDSVNQILKHESLLQNKYKKVKKLGSKINSIDVENIFFGYSPDSIFLKNINVKLKGNSFVGVIGKSGSGKSTLIDLLLKLISPSKGKIKINGSDYDYDLSRSYFAYVPQDIYLSDSTILDNILLGNISEDSNIDLVKESYKLAGLSELMDSLPKNIMTQIGENGSSLSGGQRKRLGLARAIYSQKPILILDEVTSGLDRNTELSILSDLKKMSKDKLIILVTHNSKDTMFFDKIIDLDKF